MRETLLGTRKLAKKLAVLEKANLSPRCSGSRDCAGLAEIMQILNPPPSPPEPPRRRIGFHQP